VYINTSPASLASPASPRQISVYKHFSGAGNVCLNTFQASPAPERYQISVYLESAGDVFKYTSPALEKLGKYLKTPFRRRKSIYTHFSGTGEVLIVICTYLAQERPEKPEKPEKHLYTPQSINAEGIANSLCCSLAFSNYSLRSFRVEKDHISLHTA